MTAAKKAKKTDEEILFPTITVGNYEVEPWNFGVLFEISSKIEQIVKKAEDAGIEDQLNSMNGSYVPYTVLLKIFALCSTELLETIAITLDVEVDEVKKLSMKQGISLAVAIFKQNSSVIKNSLAPLFQELATVVEETEEEGAGETSQ